METRRLRAAMKYQRASKSGAEAGGIEESTGAPCTGFIVIVVVVVDAHLFP